MTSRIPDNPFTWLVDWSPVTNMGNTIPPRDPNDDDEEEEESGEDENQPDEPAVVREPDDE
jgi:hypothetical protein